MKTAKLACLFAGIATGSSWRDNSGTYEPSPFRGDPFWVCVAAGFIIVLAQLFVFIVGPIWLIICGIINLVEIMGA